MKKFALIVAGGSGSRMNKNIPKQFIEINGLPVLMHTINAFTAYDPVIELIVVLPENQIITWEHLCSKYDFETKHRIVAGGQSRFDSVKNGLDAISHEGVVFIHDGVRPLVSVQTIDRCYKKAAKTGNALPVMPFTESVRFVDGDKNKALNRANYVTVQTPQTFKVSLIKKAYNQTYSSLFTDDASVLEKNGIAIHLVEGNRENIKITYPGDIEIACIFQNQKK